MISEFTANLTRNCGGRGRSWKPENTFWNSLTPEQRELYDKVRQLSPERQQFMKLVIGMMVDVQDTPSDARLFSLWMDSKIHDRPVKEK